MEANIFMKFICVVHSFLMSFCFKFHKFYCGDIWKIIFVIINFNKICQAQPANPKLEAEIAFIS